MSENIKVLLPEEELAERISELGAQISKDYEGESVFLVCVLKGAAMFACELAKRITVPVIMDFIATSSYEGGTVSTGVVKLKKELDLDPTGQNVIIVEDIVDTGQTLHLLTEMLIERNPASLELAVLLNKPSRRKVCLDADYVGFDIPDAFVVGWGLDYDQKYRDLPYIGVIKE